MRREILRVAQGGEVLNRIAIGGQAMPIAVVLGGEDRRTLYICCGPHPDVAVRNRLGSILAMQVDVPGAGLP